MKIKLDVDEKELLDSFERGEWKSVENLDEELKKAKQAAASFMRKDKRINIRLCSSDLGRLKRLAAREGLPYQTLISSILHRYACHASG